jgi:pimeloyl-ACP methyl ester carboxylesterase
MKKHNGKLVISERLRNFLTPELEVEFNEAYEATMLHWPVPYDNIFVSTHFGITHVVASGPMNADPVVLINPGGGSATIWIRNVEPLSQKYRIYAVDVIGEMNKSIPIRPIRNHKEFKEWISDLLDGLCIKSAHIVGNSNGGFLALETAFLLPSRVKKAILISPAATFVQMWAWWLKLLIPAHMIAPLIHSRRMVIRAYDWLWQEFPKDPAYARLKSISIVAGYPRYRPTQNSFAPHVFSDWELRQIRTPVLLMIGDHEVIYKPAQVIQRATHLIQNLKAEIVPNANHCAQYTAPEFVNQEIMAFLLNH